MILRTENGNRLPARSIRSPKLGGRALDPMAGTSPSANAAGASLTLHTHVVHVRPSRTVGIATEDTLASVRTEGDDFIERRPRRWAAPCLGSLSAFRELQFRGHLWGAGQTQNVLGRDMAFDNKGIDHCEPTGTPGQPARRAAF